MMSLFHFSNQCWQKIHFLRFSISNTFKHFLENTLISGLFKANLLQKPKKTSKRKNYDMSVAYNYLTFHIYRDICIAKWFPKHHAPCNINKFDSKSSTINFH